MVNIKGNGQRIVDDELSAATVTTTGTELMVDGIQESSTNGSSNIRCCSPQVGTGTMPSINSAFGRNRNINISQDSAPLQQVYKNIHFSPAEDIDEIDIEHDQKTEITNNNGQTSDNNYTDYSAGDDYELLSKCSKCKKEFAQIGLNDNVVGLRDPKIYKLCSNCRERERIKYRLKMKMKTKIKT